MSLASIFNGAIKLPTVPELVQELIDSIQDEDVKIDEITEKLAKDPVLTAKVLRMANSAQLGGRRKIASVNDAVVRLGFNRLRNMILPCGLVGAFDYPKFFDKKSFWKNCFEMAAIAKTIAKHGQSEPEIAFTCGMISEIGLLLMLASFPEKTEKLLTETANPMDREALEIAAHGVTTPEVSAELAKRWNFPNFVVTALRWQHHPEQSKKSELAYILTLTKFIQQERSKHNAEELEALLPAELIKGANINTSNLSADIEEAIKQESAMEEALD